MLDGLSGTYKRHGFSRSISYAISCGLKRVMVFDVTHLMVSDLNKVTNPVEVELDIECRFLEPGEVGRFAQDASNDIEPSIVNRLTTEYDYCYAGLVDGELATYCWFALDSVEAEHNSGSDSPLAGVGLSYPDDYCFRYKGFTHPKFRGQRLYQHVAAQSGEALRELGVSKILSTAEWVNYSALKSSYRSGYEYLGILGVVAPAGRRFVIKPRGLEEYGIYIDKDAEILDRLLLTSGVDESKATPIDKATCEQPATCAT